jgi:hypothetical protein
MQPLPSSRGHRSESNGGCAEANVFALPGFGKLLKTKVLTIGS